MIHYHGLPITPDMTMLAALKARHAIGELRAPAADRTRCRDLPEHHGPNWHNLKAYK